MTKNVFEITSYEGAGPIRFGMTIKQVRATMEPFDSRLKTQAQNQFAKHPTDYFLTLGVAVHYDGHGQCEAIEFSGPAIPQYKGKNLIDQDREAAESWISSQDRDVEIEPPDITSHKLGIAFFVPELPVESVLVFKRGYF